MIGFCGALGGVGLLEWGMARSPATATKTGNPDVILDLILRDRVFYLVLANRREHPVSEVRVAFRRKLMGLGGAVEISALALWARLEFLAPGKTIEVPVDRAEVFFARGPVAPLTLTLSYTDAEGERFQATITHDFEAYRGFPGIVVG